MLAAKGVEEFFLAPGGRIEVDGAAFAAGAGPIPFTRIVMTGTGVTMDAGPGTIEENGGIVTIVLGPER